MNSSRQEKILSIIKENDIETQEALVGFLKDEGFNVTQATVSRDIKKLKLLKVPSPSGNSKYAIADDAGNTYEKKLFNYLNECEAVFDYALNTVVVKCQPGMAQSLCAMIDKQNFDVEIVGTLAGDDTVFILTRSEADARRLCNLYK